MLDLEWDGLGWWGCLPPGILLHAAHDGQPKALPDTLSEEPAC